MSIALGGSSTFIVTEDSELYAMGVNGNWRLGIGNQTNALQPVLMQRKRTGQPHGSVIQSGDKVGMVAAGISHGACTAQDGAVWTWGYGRNGQLGNSSYDTRLRPFRLGTHNFGFSPAVMVACGRTFTMVLTATGHVWTCGNGNGGELGNNHVDCKNVLTLLNPHTLFHDASIEMIAAGSAHAMALDTTGNLWTWGSNEFRQLGHCGTTATDQNGSYCQTPVRLPVETFNGTAVSSMDGGKNFTMVVTTDGVLWACGYGRSGQLGLGGRANMQVPGRVGSAQLFGEHGVRMASCGDEHSLIVTKDNRVFSCGRGLYARVDNVGRSIVVDGTILFQTGLDVLLPTLINPIHFGNARIATAAAGQHHSAVVTEEGSLYVIGMLVAPTSVGLTSLGPGSANTNNPLEFDHRLPNSRMHGIKFDTIPRIVPHALLHRDNGARVGQWHRPRQEVMLAIAMNLHTRLGAGSAYNNLSEELLKTIIDNMVFNPGTVGIGLRNLMGLGSAHRYV